MEHLIKKWREITGSVKNKHIYLFLDFDGTLTFIRRDPKKVKLSVATARILKQLASMKAVSIAVISGRGLSDIRKRVGVAGIVYAGNHGLEIKAPGLRHVVPEVLKAKKTIQEISGRLKKEYRSFEGVYIEDKGLTLSVHFRMVDKRRLKEAERIFKNIIGAREAGGKVITTGGKKVWEVRPPVKWDKGKTARYLLGQERKKVKGRTIPFYIGDDRTDEDAFRLLRRSGYTVKVGRKDRQPTFADYYLNDTREVRKFLKMIYMLKGG